MQRDVCEHCGGANRPEARYCAHCGVSLSDEPSHQTQDHHGQAEAHVPSKYTESMRDVVHDMQQSLGKHRRGAKALKKLKLQGRSIYEQFETLYDAMGKLVEEDAFEDSWVGDMARDLWEDMSTAQRRSMTASYRRKLAELGKEKADYYLETAIESLRRLDSTEWQRAAIERVIFYLERLKNEPSAACPTEPLRTESSAQRDSYSLAGRKLCCPYCNKEFYTEDEDSIECPECGECFNIGEERAPVGHKLACPHCQHKFYTEDHESIDCPECSESFSIDRAGKPLGIRVTCPHCDEGFYTEDDGSVDCPECGESFTIQRRGVAG